MVGFLPETENSGRRETFFALKVLIYRHLCEGRTIGSMGLNQGGRTTVNGGAIHKTPSRIQREIYAADKSHEME
jgi:hypothetical protein